MGKEDAELGRRRTSHEPRAIERRKAGERPGPRTYECRGYFIANRPQPLDAPAPRFGGAAAVGGAVGGRGRRGLVRGPAVVVVPAQGVRPEAAEPAR